MGKEVNETPCENPVEDKKDVNPSPLQGEIIDGRSRQSIADENTQFRRHNLDGNKGAFQIRWQTGCLGCMIPFTIIFLIFFFLFRMGINAFSN
jgi:hypothetical protein